MKEGSRARRRLSSMSTYILAIAMPTYMRKARRLPRGAKRGLRERQSPTGLPLPQIFSDYGGASFDKVLFRFIEGAGKVALDIEFTCELVLHQDGDNNFTIHHGRSRKIPRIGRDIIDDYGLPAGGRRTAESGVEGDANIRGKAADERSDQQNAGVRRVDEIKAYPVVARHLFVQTLGDTLHHG